MSRPLGGWDDLLLPASVGLCLGLAPLGGGLGSGGLAARCLRLGPGPPLLVSRYKALLNAGEIPRGMHSNLNKIIIDLITAVHIVRYPFF